MSDAKQITEKTPTPRKRVPTIATPELPKGKSARSQAYTRKIKTKRSSPTMFLKMVNGTPLTGLPAIESIRKGYLVGMLKSVSSFFDVPDARIQHIVRIPATTASRLEQKKATIDAAASERVFRMSIVTRMAIDVFENKDAAITWMREPNRTFSNVAPLDLMDTEPGAEAVKQVLNAIATGGAA